MFIVNSYTLAVVFCFITMLCWGSWGNTQKLAAKSWRYELFYWDYVIGMVVFALLLAFTMGSIGSQGRPFLADISQASAASILSIILGGFIFNASNILLSASTSIAGLSVAFPLGVGLALVIGVINNYIVDVQQGTQGNVALLAIGVLLVVAAIICNGVASGKRGDSQTDRKNSRKGIILAILAGVIMSFFSRFVAQAMDLSNFAAPASGKVTPYTDIPDETFAAGVLGTGVGVEPTEGVVVAPCDGEISSVAESKHAVGVAANDMELLIHVGVDTVAMNGDGFTTYVKEGDQVKAGDLLITFDRAKIKAANHPDTVVVLLTNSDDFEDVAYPGVEE